METKQGEVIVSIILELNINLNTGAIGVTAEDVKKESTEWAIPDFGNNKIKFGKYKE